MSGRKDGIRLRKGLLISLGFITLLWLIRLVEFGTSSSLSHLGILPRTLSGSIGILTSPLIHGNHDHLLSNTFPLLFLITGLVYFYYPIALRIILLIYLVTGVWVWMVARDAYHIGASGLVFGLVTFFLFSGIFRKDIGSIAISLIVLLLYGGMFESLFTLEAGISNESHIIGSATGILTAFFFRKHGMDPEEDSDTPFDGEGGMDSTMQGDFYYTFRENSPEEENSPEN